MEMKNISNQKENEGNEYTKIQFIGLCLSTTPGNLKSIEGMSDDGNYLGVPYIKNDIAGRIEIVTKLLDYACKEINKQDNTLYVFVLPEFFFRGSTGAYQRASTQTPYEFFVNKFASLITFLKDYQDCILVAGSVLSSTIAYNANENTEPGKSLCMTGDSLLNVYYRLHSTQKDGAESRHHPSMHELLKMIDESTSEELDKLSTEDTAFVDVLRRTLDKCDETTNIVVDNSAYVIFGGKNAPAPMRIPKMYKSKEDFVLNRYFPANSSNRTGYLQSNTKYAPITHESEIKNNDFDTGAIFDYKGIWFGIDICLDHSRQRLVNQLRKYPDNFVDVQIITSCGMEIRENAVTAKHGKWVFNCDGEYMLNNQNLGVDGENCHTSLRKVTGQLTFDVNGEVSPAELSFAEKTLSEKDITYEITEGFYPETKCHVHIYAPYPIHG